MSHNQKYKTQKFGQVSKKINQAYSYIIQNNYQEGLRKINKYISKEMIQKTIAQLQSFSQTNCQKKLTLSQFSQIINKNQIVLNQQMDLNSVAFSFYTQDQFFIASPDGIVNVNIRFRNYKGTIFQLEQHQLFKSLQSTDKQKNIIRQFPNQRVDLSELFNWLTRCLMGSIVNQERKSNKSQEKKTFKGLKSYLQDIRKQTNQKYYYYNHVIVKSQSRTIALKLCKWQHYQSKYNYQKIINPSTRDLAILIFNFNFPTALKIINNMQQIDQLIFIKPLIAALKDIHEKINKNDLANKLFLNNKNFPFDFKQDNNDNFIQNIKSELKFIIKLFNNFKPKDPYLKFICIFIGKQQDPSNQGWNQIIDLQGIKILDLFGFAFKFMTEDKLIQFFNIFQKKYKQTSDLNSIIFFGDSQSTIQILQNYVDQYNDLQITAILSIIFRLFKYNDSKKKFDFFIRTYQENLKFYGFQNKINQFKKQFINFQKKFNNNSPNSDVNKISYAMKCCQPNCDCLLYQRLLLKTIDKSKPGFTTFYRDQRKRMKQCPHCKEILPNCCICLLPISIINPYVDYVQQVKKIKKSEMNINQIIADGEQGITWCMKCSHGGHYNHMMEWFQKEQKCPICQCGCYCKN